MAIEKTRLIFIRDIHLSSTTDYRSRKYPSWYRLSRHEARLLSFLDQCLLRQSSKIKDLVLPTAVPAGSGRPAVPEV